LFWLYDPAFGDSDDEDMHLNDALGKDMDEDRADCPDEAGTFCMTYCVVWMMATFFYFSDLFRHSPKT
jgi:hypothetical protein